MELEPIEKLVRAGFVYNFMRQFSELATPYPATFISAADRAQALNAAISRLFKNRQPVYPFAFLRITSVQDNTESYNSLALNKAKLPVTVDSDGRQFQTIRVIPTKFDVDVTWVTNAADGQGSVEFFVRRWLSTRRMGGLQYGVNYGRLHFSVICKLNESVSQDMRENPADNEAQYSVNASLVIHGFTSEEQLGTRGRFNDLVLSMELAPGSIPF